MSCKEDMIMATIGLLGGGQSSEQHPHRPIDVIVRRTEEEGEDSDDDVFVQASSELPMAWQPINGGPVWKIDEEFDVHGDELIDAQGNIVSVHEHMHYRRRQTPSSGTALIDDGDMMEEEMEEDITVCFPFYNAQETAGNMVKRFWAFSVKLRHFQTLPEWMQDNDYLHRGHRPPMPHFGHCFRSVFQMHTETGNIWTHLLGCIAFIGIAGWFLSRPTALVQWQDKLAFSPFFFGAIMCMGLSSLFHTVSCHSRGAQKLFSKLDYVGISLLVVGSFIPWLYYGFYCRQIPMIVYMLLMLTMGGGSVCVSLLDKFAEPAYRPVRAGMFVAMGLSALVPTAHYWYTDGFASLLHEASLVWMVSMGVLYILGAFLYAMRIPERFFPGKCDIWFQSHQIFHIMVVMAAFVHYHGINEMAQLRLERGSCAQQLAAKWPHIYSHLVEYSA